MSKEKCLDCKDLPEGKVVKGHDHLINKDLPVSSFTVHGYTLYKFSYLEGRIRTIIESLGLPQKQEKAVSQLIINETWGMWDKPEYSYQYEIEEGEVTRDNARLVV